MGPTKAAKRGAGYGRKRALAFNPQGSGRSVAKSFGSGGKHPKKKIKQQPLSISKFPSRCWDAFDSSHAALPRAVGPYTVIRTTMIHKTSAKAMMVGTFNGSAGIAGTAENTWSNYVIAEQSGGETLVIGTDNATKFFGIPPPGAPAYGDGASTNQCCPSAISVQIMGNESLNSAKGQLAAGVVPANMDIRGSPLTWKAIGAEFISYFRPRLLSGGKLALRGVQMNSHPLNMTDVSDFRQMRVTADSAVGVAWPATSQNAPEGWAPMFISNPDASDITLLVTVEWRVRFNIGNPAVSSHQHHGVTSDRAWDDHIRAAVKVLPGVIDIVENVAQRGMAVKAAYSALAG